MLEPPFICYLQLQGSCCIIFNFIERNFTKILSRHQTKIETPRVSLNLNRCNNESRKPFVKKMLQVFRKCGAQRPEKLTFLNDHIASSLTRRGFLTFSSVTKANEAIARVNNTPLETDIETGEGVKTKTRVSLNVVRVGRQCIIIR